MILHPHRIDTVISDKKCGRYITLRALITNQI